ncbi:MAG: site-specific integrase [Deltaproteobacteria bacterium]|nr:site-specific integrase [Deltaproteobacteria bacterium]
MDTERWLIRVKARSRKTGRIGERLEQFRGTRAEAIATREQWRLELVGDVVQRERQTLEAVAKSWLQLKIARGDLATSTADRYARALDDHILPALGDVFLEELTRADVDRWLAGVGQEPSTCNGYLRVLRSVLEGAVADELVPANVATRVAPLKERTRDEPNALTADELRRVLEHWRATRPEQYPLVLALALTGARWGEITALRWSDIDAAAAEGALTIRRAHHRGEVKEPKTGVRRIVPFPRVLARVLEEHRKRCLREQRPGFEDGWVFTSSEGTLLDNGRLSKPWREVLGELEIAKRVTMHGLRHTMTDLLRHARVDQVTSAALIGHTTEQMRRRYSTVLPAEARAAGDQVVRMAGLAGGRIGGSRRRK